MAVLIQLDTIGIMCKYKYYPHISSECNKNKQNNFILLLLLMFCLIWYDLYNTMKSGAWSSNSTYDSKIVRRLKGLPGPNICSYLESIEPFFVYIQCKFISTHFCSSQFCVCLFIYNILLLFNCAPLYSFSRNRSTEYNREIYRYRAIILWSCENDGNTTKKASNKTHAILFRTGVIQLDCFCLWREIVETVCSYEIRIVHNWRRNIIVNKT